MLNKMLNEQDQKSCNVELKELEDAIYPIEFLSVVQDTALKALQDYLRASDAPKAVLALLEDLAVLTTWTGEVEKGVQVRQLVNQFLQETVASASRNIVAIGGEFYSPSGTTIRREIVR